MNIFSFSKSVKETIFLTQNILEMYSPLKATSDKRHEYEDIATNLS